jgi:acetyl-CoA carboxylase, biotin carboxylase subunit
MFDKVLVANRGEIAVRILRTLREMSITSVAVYSEVDAQALHVHSADEAVLLGDGDSAPAASYLNAERIIEAARSTGAQAIHPGYGFLSENADFAAQVTAAGLTFIGPPAEVIAQLGNKTTARRILAAAGVPIVPGMQATADDPAVLSEAAREMGYPVLIKAAAGGGGKGMRIVHADGDLAEAATAASSEARNAFGDGSIYLEKYLDRPRHVEVQILADAQGNAIHLFERECSIQRRHQKIIEETPSPALNAGLRARMGEAAVAAAKAVGYVNAGTVEFLLDDAGSFYFLEVNTRLQVEHPITEVTVGLDLVRHQLEIAAGGTLSMTQPDVSQRGHAIECRIYAEDPAEDFMPCPGTVLYCRPAAGPGVRFDAGVYSGAEVPVHYDPILGKLIVWAEDRPAAIARMIQALRDNVLLGVQTATELMIDILASEPFAKGDTHTKFLADHFAQWRPSEEGNARARVGYVAAELTGVGHTGAQVPTHGETQWPSPWQTLGHWTLRG